MYIYIHTHIHKRDMYSVFARVWKNDRLQQGVVWCEQVS